jgi:hypothetical protein
MSVGKFQTHIEKQLDSELAEKLKAEKAKQDEKLKAKKAEQDEKSKAQQQKDVWKQGNTWLSQRVHS